MKNFCESCLIDCEWRGDVVFCDDCNELSSCNEYCMCPREEFVSHNDCYIPYEYPEIKECEDGYKPPEKEYRSKTMKTVFNPSAAVVVLYGASSVVAKPIYKQLLVATQE